MKVGRHTYGHEQISVRHWGEPAELSIGSFCSIVAGDPARLLRHRFDPDTVERLLGLAWWDWSDERIAANLELLCSPRIERFLDSQEGRHGRQRLWKRLLGSRR